MVSMLAIEMVLINMLFCQTGAQCCAQNQVEMLMLTDHGSENGSISHMSNKLVDTLLLKIGMGN